MRSVRLFRHALSLTPLPDDNQRYDYAMKESIALPDTKRNYFGAHTLWRNIDGAKFLLPRDSERTELAGSLMPVEMFVDIHEM